MNYHVTIYCPDRHLIYEGRTPDKMGVGGGVMARLRLAQALARCGHRVTIVGNVSHPHAHDGVDYRPLQEVHRIDCDVLILNSTGGSLDLTPVQDLKVDCRLKEVWVGGNAPVRGLNEVGFDFLVAPSNFIRNAVREEWTVPPGRIFVAYNGVLRRKHPFSFWGSPPRNSFRLTYCSHPSKGLESALAVLRCLRKHDKRFELHVFGGNKLWGGEEHETALEEGVSYHGMVGQRRLASELQQSGFSLNLQARLEPFGMVVTEAMAAGDIVLASPVGAYSEIVRHGFDGFLIPGDYAASETVTRAAALIVKLVRHPEFSVYIRKNAITSPLDWDTVARAWAGHWRWALKDMEESEPSAIEAFGEECLDCGSPQLPLADGFHCTGCGRYSRSLQNV